MWHTVTTVDDDAVPSKKAFGANVAADLVVTLARRRGARDLSRGRRGRSGAVAARGGHPTTTTPQTAASPNSRTPSPQRRRGPTRSRRSSDTVVHMCGCTGRSRCNIDSRAL